MTYPEISIDPALVAKGGLASVAEQFPAFAAQVRTSGQTFGQKAVGLALNPGGDPAVTASKRHYADAIDQLQMLRETSTSAEQKRLASIAITETQAAQMWAVKALTWKD